MPATGLIAAAALLWLGVLFAVAVFGERRAPAQGLRAGVVYALSLAIYCTSWTFYGTVTQATRNGWWLPPTFLGTILLYVLALPFLDRLVATAKSLNATSVADFVASRFGKSSGLAALLTGVVLLGMVPYIALQLKAVAMSYQALRAGAGEPPPWQDSALLVAVIMAVFAMLFGTRRTAADEHNRGLVLAMAFEAVFKLVAILIVGGFAAFVLYGSPAELATAWRAQEVAAVDPQPVAYLTLTVLGALAMFTLPHQFHVGVVECEDRARLRTARWLFPLFLVAISLPIWPLARAGQLQLGAALPSDLYVLGLPLAHGESGLALLAFLGGMSAATGMVILATLALGIMLGNHWMTPLLVRRGAAHGVLADVRLQRRLGIALVLGLGYAYSRLLGGVGALADIGAQSFSALAQLAPAVVLAVYRPTLPARAIGAGVVAGGAVWAYVLIVPLLAAGAPWLQTGPMGLRWLAPAALLGLDGLDALSRAVWLSLLVNVAVLALLARGATVPRERTIAAPLDPGALQAIARRFLTDERIARLFAAGGGLKADPQLEARVGHELTAVLGAASTRLLLDAARRGSGRQLEQVAEIVGEAAQAARFSQQVLEAALENMSQGISVVDAQLRLVAWNRRYAALFDYPAGLLQVGIPVESLVRWNAARGLAGSERVDAEVGKRIAHMRAGTPYVAERRFPDGAVVEIRGNPMPGGGFVATFTDVTAFRRTEAELKRVAETLEQRVAERTAQLERTKGEAERANQAKSRFLAAISHDLAQPLNAAHLFVHALAQQLRHPQYREAVRNIDGALGSAEGLLAGLLDISRLDTGGMAPSVETFRLDQLLQHLAAEFRVLAHEKGLELRLVGTGAWVRSDPQLLRRVLQNFLANAVRYTRHGRIVLGCRRRGEALRIEVWDTGPGIEEADRTVIFEEFRRLDRGGGGLGLGLAIAERIGRLLGHRIDLRSQPGRGTCFSIAVPLAAPVPHVGPVTEPAPRAPRSRVLVVDNDPAVLAGMRALLEGWRCEVAGATTFQEAEAAIDGVVPDLLLLDYHLDGAATGVDLYRRLQQRLGEVPAIVITADHSGPVAEAVAAAGCALLHKPLKPLALKSVMGRLLSARHAARPATVGTSGPPVV
ncbi:MAG TPA: NahK/ErcS family hybrid sensor histidine kinase/response regulator [Xanthomonadaceae bacterium]|nr:NahK/ErcS family hybrid sensor histidine kinase/response regulator [Xanthomonadaceae bacterium]